MWFLLWTNEIIKIRIKGVKLVVKFNKEGVELIRNKINSEELKTTVRLKKTSFTRKRKMGFTKLMKYILNKKELTTRIFIMISMRKKIYPINHY